ncbi:MAG: hypothetical protein V1725_06690 [archaeon]
MKAWLLLLTLLVILSAAQAQLIMTDPGGTFYLDAKEKDSWNIFPYHQYDTTSQPYVDTAKLAVAKERFIAYAKHRLAEGYNAFVIGDMQRVISLPSIDVYPVNSSYVIRAEAYKTFFNDIMRTPELENASFYLTSDYQFTDSFISAFVRHDFSAENERLMQLNKAALEEVCTSMPRLSGIIIRIGEGGQFYTSSAEYTSVLSYTTEQDISRLIDTLLPLAKKHNKTLIFRTWTVGIGKIGDLMYNPDKYDNIFRTYNTSHLITSIKNGEGDFFSFLPKERLLGRGSVQQLVEFQLRREYEGYGSLTNYLVDSNKDLLADYTTRKNFAGVYVWTHFGGWDRANNQPDTPAGFWTELNSAVFPLIVHNPAYDTDRALQENLQSTGAADALFAFVKDSHTIIQDILYVKAYAERPSRVRNVPLPTLLWLWWDRPMDAHFALVHVYLQVKNVSEEASRTNAALDRFMMHKQAILNGTSTPFIRQSLDYQEKTLSFLAKYKLAFLSYYEFIKKKDENYLLAAQATAAEAKSLAMQLEHEYGKDEALPSMDFSDAYQFIERVERYKQRQLLLITSTLAFALVAVLILLRILSLYPVTDRAIIAVFIGATLSSPLAFMSRNDVIIGCLLVVIFLIWLVLVRLVFFRQKSKLFTHLIMLFITFFVLFLNVFVFKLIPDRLWFMLHDIVFKQNYLSMFFALSLYVLFCLSLLFLFKTYGLLEEKIRKQLLFTFAYGIAALIIIWCIALFKFGYINNLFDAFPSIMLTHGSGADIIQQLSFFKLF